MIDDRTGQEIVKQLDRLPPDLQQRVVDYARALACSSRRGVPGKNLLAFAGILSKADAQAIAQAIEESCEKVDVNEW